MVIASTGLGIVTKKLSETCFLSFTYMLNTVLVDKPLPFATINISFISTCSKENFEVAKLSAVCWLDVSGKLEMSELPPGIVYDIFYVVKLTKGASAGWELPITLRLSLPDGRVLCRQLSLLMKPRGEWIELNVGSFQPVKGKTGEVCFGLCEHRGHWKTGLIIKGAIIRARN